MPPKIHAYDEEKNKNRSIVEPIIIKYRDTYTLLKKNNVFFSVTMIVTVDNV